MAGAIITLIYIIEKHCIECIIQVYVCMNEGGYKEEMARMNMGDDRRHC